MIKTQELVKDAHTTMYFPRIIIDRAESEHLHRHGQIRPAWLRMVVVNHDDFADVWQQKRELRASDAYLALVATWTHRHLDLQQDVHAFANGDMDLIDMVVKYGVGYKQCRQFVKDVFAQAKHTMDVDAYWKQHKKHKQKETTLQKYGVHHSAIDPAVQAKRIATNRKRYGADNPMQTEAIREKLRKNIRERYGVDYTFQRNGQVDQWRQKLYNTLTSDTVWYDILHATATKHDIVLDASIFTTALPVSRRDFVISTLSNDNVEDLLRLWQQHTGCTMEYPANVLFQLPFMFSKTWLAHYDKRGLLVVPQRYYEVNASIYEKRIKDALDALGVDYVVNRRKLLGGSEIDLFIPDKNIGIEVNPNISHNSNRYATQPNRNMFDSYKQPSYHYDKYKQAQDANITLLQLFANDLVEPTFSMITIKRLEGLLCGYTARYGARKVRMVQVASDADRKVARSFLDTYHTQGSSRAKEYWLFYLGDAIIGCASFSTKGRGRDIELKRLCFQPGIQIVGGLSKLIRQYFRTHPTCDKVYSYSDNNLGNGNGYAQAGATFVKETGPSLKFISPRDGRDAYSWQIATTWGASKGVVGNDARERGLPVPTTQDEIDTYIETTLRHRYDDGEGYDRIYTAGSKLWVFER